MREDDWAIVAADSILGKVLPLDRVTRIVRKVYRKVSYQEVQ